MSKRDTYEILENRYQYILDKMNENYNYIHYSNYSDVYEQILGSTVLNLSIRERKNNIDDVVTTINNYLMTIFNSSTVGDVTAWRGDKQIKVKNTTLDINKLINENDIISLAILMLQQPSTANRLLKDNTKLINKGNFKKLRTFVSVFGGDIKYITNDKGKLELIVTPPSKDRKLGAFSIDDVEKYADVVKDAINEIDINNDTTNTLQGTMTEIGGALLVAAALSYQKDFYSTIIKNLGKKSRKETAIGNSKMIIDSAQTAQILKTLERKLEDIRQKLGKVENRGIKVQNVFNKQGKVDFSVGNLNFSAKNYWTDNKFELSSSEGNTLASLGSLMMAYYPDYGYGSKNFHIFLNLMALRGNSGNMGKKLIENYKKIIKNLIIGYDVDILFLSRNGVPVALNAWDAYDENKYFKLNGDFYFKNTFSHKKNLNEAAISRSERIFYNMMSSRYKVEGNASLRIK